MSDISANIPSSTSSISINASDTFTSPRARHLSTSPHSPRVYLVILSWINAIRRNSALCIFLALFGLLSLHFYFSVRILQYPDTDSSPLTTPPSSPTNPNFKLEPLVLTESKFYALERRRLLNRSSSPAECSNSVQGLTHITDDTGRVCERIALNINGCCDKDSPRITCESCHTAIPCCSSYEYCISCCLSASLSPNPTGTNLTTMEAIPDHFSSTMFDQCRAQCRTSSSSLLHGNTYKHAYRHCYSKGTTDLPELESLQEEKQLSKQST